MGWKAQALIDYAAAMALDSLFITDLDAFESLDEAPLRALREYATARRLQIQVGTWSICPTSKAFKPKWGTADEHLALAIRVARALGSPVIRVVLGTWEDRLTDGGIDRHIDETVKVCRAQRARAVDAGVKIAVENHAGDMDQALSPRRELAEHCRQLLHEGWARGVAPRHGIRGRPDDRASAHGRRRFARA